MPCLAMQGLPEAVGHDLLPLPWVSGGHMFLQSSPTLCPEPYPTYISFEREARALLNYECLFVPGLLQTEQYARAALQRGTPTGTREEVQRLVEARMSRQAVLTRDPPPRLRAIVDEAALHRPE